jgi:8-oxo-dGTP pyrophosphatase MutT (NUDIX family)
MHASRKPTHAGGVVYRSENGLPKFLLVTSRRRPQAWIFPKGRIERGETPEDAAEREVHEESGVSATTVVPVDDVRIQVAGENRIIRYFLMRAVRSGRPGEGRRSLWLSPHDALERLSYSRSRASLRKALDLMRERGLLKPGQLPG